MSDAGAFNTSDAVINTDCCTAEQKELKLKNSKLESPASNQSASLCVVLQQIFLFPEDEP